MKQDLLDSLPAKFDSLTVNKKDFNSLPPEIIKEVFCNIESNDLYALKAVCTYWRDTIQEICDIQRLEVNAQQLANAVNIFDSWKKCSNGEYDFSMYRSSYSLTNIVSKAIINHHIDEYLYKLNEITFAEALEELQFNATNGGVYCGGCDDVDGSVRETILALTEIQYSIEELREKSFTDKLVQSSMAEYRWYRFMSSYMWGMSCKIGLIVLYPDNRTFCVLVATDFD